MTQTPTDALRLVPVEPTEAVLTNMAIRFDHGLGCPGYYDNPIFGEPNHARRFEAAKTTMRQLYEEVVLSAAAPASPLPEGGGWLGAEHLSGAITRLTRVTAGDDIESAYADFTFPGHTFRADVRALLSALPAAPTGDAK